MFEIFSLNGELAGQFTLERKVFFPLGIKLEVWKENEEVTGASETDVTKIYGRSRDLGRQNDPIFSHSFIPIRRIEKPYAGMSWTFNRSSEGENSAISGSTFPKKGPGKFKKIIIAPSISEASTKFALQKKKIK